MNADLKTVRTGLVSLLAGIVLVGAAFGADPDPKRFEKAIDRFAAGDRKNAPPSDPILFVGSSSIVMWQSAEAFPGYPIVNRGFGGSHISDVLHYYEQVVRPYDPKLIVFYCGDNDIASGKTPERVLADFAKFRARVSEDFGSVPMIYIPIKPCRSRWEFWPKSSEVNQTIEKQARSDASLIYADTASVLYDVNGEPDASLFLDDQLHLNADGYAKWNAVVAPLLAKYAEASLENAGEAEKAKLAPLTAESLSIRFVAYLPRGYEQDSEKTWPLVLFLHGSGERGDDLTRVLFHGPPKHAKAGEPYPFILIAPQCPNGRWWSMGELVSLLDHAQQTCRVDPDRVYLTGLSMGGFGSFQLASIVPERFAAVAPVCGGGDVQTAARLKDVPVWAFHGSADPVVPADRSREMVNAINAAGGNAKLTVYPNVGHDSWTKTYADPVFWRWLLSQKRAAPGSED